MRLVIDKPWSGRIQNHHLIVVRANYREIIGIFGAGSDNVTCVYRILIIEIMFLALSLFSLDLLLRRIDLLI